MKTIGVLLLIMVTFSSFGQKPNPEQFGVSSKSIPTGLNVGEKAPNFTVAMADGKVFNLYKELKSKPIVLIFFRGYWCPVCNRYLSAYQDSLHLITARGVQFVAVTPETYHFVAKTREKTKAGFEILSDVGGKIMKAYHVNFMVTQAYQNRIKSNLHASIAATNGQDEASLPVPATFIIKKDGTIAYRQFDLNYHNRATVSEILKNLP